MHVQLSVRDVLMVHLYPLVGCMKKTKNTLRKPRNWESICLVADEPEVQSAPRQLDDDIAKMQPTMNAISADKSVPCFGFKEENKENV